MLVLPPSTSERLELRTYRHSWSCASSPVPLDPLPWSNSGGVIAGMFSASQRGLALCVFASAPFLGPILGPTIRGFARESAGWRWVEVIVAIFTGVLWIGGMIVVPESYTPVLLKWQATKISSVTGKVYVARWSMTRASND